MGFFDKINNVIVNAIKQILKRENLEICVR